MKINIKKTLSISLPLLLGVFLIWYSYNKFSEEQLREIQHYFSNANYRFVLISVLCGFLSHLSRAYRWNYMLKPLGYKPKIANNTMAVFVGYIMNLVIPRSGEFSRALIINKYEDVPYDKALGTIIGERVADMLILLIIVASAFFIQLDVLKDFVLSIVPIKNILILLFILILLGLAFLWFVYKTNNVLSNKIRGFVTGIFDGILSIIKMKNKWGFIFHTLFIWVMYVAMFYINIYALPETSNMAAGTVISAFIVGSFTIAFTNGGFGSYPFFISKILALFSIPLTLGTAFGWIVWIAQFVMMVFFGALSLILLPIYNRNK
ncbi:hypothetical protein SAMN05216480_1099 [Pustulibacterium marinum]|uniref:Lysylphosphatidylglycerol synthase TM region n=1 Tax=Pustulibacterium marinum TaxID=1224947 RepID=A0A1I7HFY1_9FLAO|nr:hypothetical protein SAMN05216480_1099 [Pustulibacterium marinum]